MSELQIYQRRYPIQLRARPLEEGETVYDNLGQVIYPANGAKPGDMLIVLVTDRMVMNREIFDALYAPIPDPGEDNNGREREAAVESGQSALLHES